MISINNLKNARSTAFLLVSFAAKSRAFFTGVTYSRKPLLRVTYESNLSRNNYVVTESREKFYFFATKSLDVSRFTNQGKLVLQQVTKSRVCRDSRVSFVQSVVSIHTTYDNLICCKTGANGGGKTRNISFNTFCSNIPKQVARFGWSFYRSLTLSYPFIHRGLWR